MYLSFGHEIYIKRMLKTLNGTLYQPFSVNEVEYPLTEEPLAQHQTGIEPISAVVVLRLYSLIIVNSFFMLQALQLIRVRSFHGHFIPKIFRKL